VTSTPDVRAVFAGFATEKCGAQPARHFWQCMSSTGSPAAHSQPPPGTTFFRFGSPGATAEAGAVVAEKRASARLSRRSTSSRPTQRTPARSLARVERLLRARRLTGSPKAA
jgi:hypothetical protein